MLNKVADFYDEEVSTATDGLTSLIEPLMMASLGVIVGGMIIALYLPMFEVITLVK
jgi:type IV pilus assembly protein PilC